MAKIFKYVFLAASYNRREQTVDCVNSIMGAIGEPEGRYRIVIVDNNSTDGTSEALQGIKGLRIILTPENMYWAQAMRFGYHAIPFKYEHLVCINDDTSFTNNLQSFLKEAADHDVIVGRISDMAGNYIYGAWTQSALGSSLTEKSSAVKCFNMNCVAIRRETLDRYGFLRNHFVHSMADFDYARRLTSKGVSVAISKDFVGTGARNPKKRFNRLNIIAKFRHLLSPKKYPIYPTLRYALDHFGILAPFYLVRIYCYKAILRKEL